MAVTALTHPWEGKDNTVASENFGHFTTHVHGRITTYRQEASERNVTS